MLFLPFFSLSAHFLESRPFLLFLIIFFSLTRLAQPCIATKIRFTLSAIFFQPLLFMTRYLIAIFQFHFNFFSLISNHKNCVFCMIFTFFSFSSITKDLLNQEINRQKTLTTKQKCEIRHHIRFVRWFSRLCCLILFLTSDSPTFFVVKTL